MADVQNIDDYKVTIDGTSYPMTSIPADGSAIVVRQRAEIMRNLQLDQVIAGLEKSRKLLRCAYNGVAGFGELRGEVLGLQDDLSQLCDKTSKALDVFKQSSSDILSNMGKMFKNLITPGKAALGLTYLKSCADTAQKLSVAAGALADEFKALADRTIATTKATMTQQGLTEQQKRDYEQKSLDLKAQMDAADYASKELEKLSTSLNQRYEQAHADAEKESDRAFTVAIVGAIMKPLASGLGTFASVYGGRGAGAAANASPGTDAGQQPADAPATAPGDPSASGTTTPGTGKQAAAAGAADATKQAADDLSKESDKLNARADSAHQLELDLLKLQQKTETDRITQAQFVMKFAAELKNLGNTIEVTGVTIMALQIAVGALKQVSVALRNASRFWGQMKTFCDRSNSPESGLQSDVARVTQNKDDYAMLIDSFKTDDDFKSDFVTYVAGWSAIRLVSQQYIDDLEKILKNVEANIEENPNTAQSLTLAKELGASLQLDTQAELDEASKRKAALDAELGPQKAAA